MLNVTPVTGANLKCKTQTHQLRLRVMPHELVFYDPDDVGSAPDQYQVQFSWSSSWAGLLNTEDQHTPTRDVVARDQPLESLEAWTFSPVLQFDD